MTRNTSQVRPQSGSRHRPAPESGARQDEAPAPQAPSSVHPVEPEDAWLTGTSRSLQRRVLGLNVDARQSQEHPEAVPGQHATGSFTGTKEGRKRR